MEYNIVELSASEKEVEIKLEYDEIKNQIEAEVKKLSKNIQVPGFRKGKVPSAMIKKLYGEALEYEASEKVANDFFWSAAEKNNIRPIGQPAMTDHNFEPGKTLSFKVKFETVPILEVKNYTGLTIELPDFIVTEEQIEQEIEYILKSNKTTEDAEVITDENYIIDAELFLVEKNGEKIQNTKPEKMQIDLTSEGISKDIIANAKDKKVGESFIFSFNDEHKHKLDDGTDEVHKEEFVYSVNILGLKKIILPELNEELIKKVTNDASSTESELRENIRKDIQNFYDQKSEEMLNIKFIDEIIKSNDFIPPKTFVNNLLEDYLNSEAEQAKKSKRAFIKDDARKRLEKSTENEVKWYLIKTEILKKENITFNEEELNEMAKKESEQTGIALDKVLNYYNSANFKDRMLDKKFYDFLKLNNNVVKVDPKNLNDKQEANDE